MCLITLSWQPASNTPLIIVANRDEFYARPTAALHHWPDLPILAGKDLQAGGTWLGVAQTPGSSQVRLAALTNHRDVGSHRLDAPSRGHIATAFVTGAMSAAEYLHTLSITAGMYNPFNLILFDGQNLLGFESRRLRTLTLPVGISSVSNADFNTPWPKLVRLQHDFERTLARQAGKEPELLELELFALLANDAVAPDAELPQTGIGLARERALSAAFIRTPDYGSRACSVICVGEAATTFVERSFDADGCSGQIKATLALTKP